MADSVAKVSKGTAADFPPKKPKRANIADPCNRIARITCEFGAWWGSLPHYCSIVAPTARMLQKTFATLLGAKQTLAKAAMSEKWIDACWSSARTI
jgi:hypothetical protein